MHTDISNPAKVLEVQRASIGFVKFIKEKLHIQLVKHMKYNGEEFIDGVTYRFFKSKNKFWHIPFKTHRYIKSQEPDIVLVQALIFPLQLIILRLQLGRNTEIIAQHHGEKPWQSTKKFFQQAADRFINAYLFTTLENANDWIEKKIISSKTKCYEVLEASTSFKKRDKCFCKEQVSFTGNKNFLWVGRLNEGKDPITVLNAFGKYIASHPDAKLFMIYQTNELLPEIKVLLHQNKQLKNSVVLKGSILNNELETWYNAADFFISGSHKESTGYALIEAMACGCIPVVTNIPSFKKITGSGKYGFLFEPGNEESLLNILQGLDKSETGKLPEAIIDHFNSSLSFQSIADELYDVCEKLISK